MTYNWLQFSSQRSERVLDDAYSKQCPRRTVSKERCSQWIMCILNCLIIFRVMRHVLYTSYCGMLFLSILIKGFSSVVVAATIDLPASPIEMMATVKLSQGTIIGKCSCKYDICSYNPLQHSRAGHMSLHTFMAQRFWARFMHPICWRSMVRRPLPILLILVLYCPVFSSIISTSFTICTRIQLCSIILRLRSGLHGIVVESC